MEIKDPVHGRIELSLNEVQVLDNRCFQRLRAIKQLGFAEYSFPGAVHNRYIHSLGVMHLAGLAFDNIFREHEFSTPAVRARLRQVVRLAALLHDVGHGPLSHTTEEVMPTVGEVNVKAYQYRKPSRRPKDDDRASHEDYTIKFIMDSDLTVELRENFPDIDPLHVACLIDKNLIAQDDFFVDRGVNYRTVLSQVVSSEMDVDRMDYLGRDAYFCGTNYGKVELEWLIGNLTFHEVQGEAHLALNRRAIYTFDDFLISRHHMYLMVYFHHKSIIFEEMLMRYLTSEDCSYFLPPELDKYLKCTDYSLYEHLASVDNRWAQRISTRRPYRMLFEMHETENNTLTSVLEQVLLKEEIDVIHANSETRLSKYHTINPEEKSQSIYVVDPTDPFEKPVPIENCTGIFQRYEETRTISRLYVAAEEYERARKILVGYKKT